MSRPKLQVFSNVLEKLDIRNFYRGILVGITGSSIIDVTVLGRGGQGFCDSSTKALVVKRVRMGEGASKRFKIM